MKPSIKLRKPRTGGFAARVTGHCLNRRETSRGLRLARFTLLFFLTGIHLFAQNFPRLDPDQAALKYAHAAAGNGVYTWIELAEISFWASGDSSAGNAAPAGKVSGMEQIRAAAAELRASPGFPRAERDRAQYILTYMHQKLLRSYSHSQTRLDTLLSGGRYNCVSSAVLYMILAQSCGLNVTGEMTRDHAFAVVRAADGSIDVETTSPLGFDPGSRREFNDEFGRVTGFAYVPARNYRDRAAVSPLELVSLILSNRISELESRGRFFEAVPLAVDRAVLLGAISAPGSVLSRQADIPSGGDSRTPFFESPRRDVMNRIFNYGAFLLNAGKEEDCLRWAALASPGYPDSERWQEFISAAVNNRIQKLAKAGQFSGAREFLERHKNALGPGNYAPLDSMLTGTELFDRASRIRNSGDGDSVLALIEVAHNKGLIDDNRADELVVLTVQKTAAILSAARPLPDSGGSARDWPGAVGYIQKAAGRFGTSRGLERLLRDYQANYAIDFHNRFAAAWNKKNYQEARRVINDGLALFPGNKQLLADKQLLD